MMLNPHLRGKSSAAGEAEETNRQLQILLEELKMDASRPPTEALLV